MTRAEHLQWAKTRALEYCAMDRADLAWASFMSDLLKHEETAPLNAVIMSAIGDLLSAGLALSAESVREIIEEVK